ncbi:MAG: OadG family protein [Anaerolineae bacterium]|nr:OadG family protein [Anaerolineae bacterium]
MTGSFNLELLLTIYGLVLAFLILAVLGIIIVLLRRERGPVQAETTPAGPDLELEPDLVTAITIAVLTHRAIRRKQAAPAMRSHQPGALPSRWVGSGRARQANSWQPDRR